MDRIPQPGDIYQHFKGNMYRVLTLARHSETDETLVVYQALYGSFEVYARPLSSFMGRPDAARYPQQAGKDRFTLVPAAGVAAQAVQAPDAPGKDLSAKRQTDAKAEAPEGPSESEPDPVLLAFLEADSYERKLEIFSTLAGRADPAVLSAIAASLDLELTEGTAQEQYETLKNCLLTLERYECSRLR